MGHCPKMFSDSSGACALLESVKVQRNTQHLLLNTLILIDIGHCNLLNICENFVQNFRDLQD